MATLTVWPGLDRNGVSLVEYAEDGVTLIPASGGAVVTYSDFYARKIAAGRLCTNDPLALSGDAVSVQPVTRVSASLTGQVTPQVFGAVADGATDCSAAFQAAVNSAAASGGSVRIPPGTYLLMSTVTVNGDVEIIGSGSAVTTLASTSLATMIGVVSDTGIIRKFSISGVTLSGGKEQLYIHPWIWERSSTVEDIVFYNYSRKGLRIETEAVSVQLRNVNCIAGAADAGQSTYGIYALGDAVLHYAVIDSMRATQNTGAGLFIAAAGAAGTGGSVGTLIKAAVFEANGGPGIHLKSAGIIMYDAFFENNGSASGQADIEVDTNYTSGVVTYSRIDAYSTTFADSNSAQLNGSTGTYKRIEYVQNGVKARFIGGYVADSYPSHVYAGSYATNSTEIDGLPLLRTVTTYGQLAQRAEQGHTSLGVFACEGSTPTDTGVSVYGGSYGGCAEVLASGHVNPGPTTRSCKYWLNFPYDASHGTFSATSFGLAGMTDFVTFSISASGTLKFKATDNTNAAISIIAGKSE